MADKNEFSVVYLNVTSDISRSGSRLEHTPGIQIFKGHPDMQRAFAEYLSEVYVYELKRAITTQRYRRTWIPLNEKYRLWKEMHGLNTDMWIRTGHLKKVIRAFYDKKNRAWRVGIDPRSRTDVLDSQGKPTGKKVQTLLIARVLEYGSADRGIPARPLFRPIRDYIRKNIRVYVKRWLMVSGFYAQALKAGIV